MVFFKSLTRLYVTIAGHWLKHFVLIYGPRPTQRQNKNNIQPSWSNKDGNKLFITCTWSTWNRAFITTFWLGGLTQKPKCELVSSPRVCSPQNPLKGREVQPENLFSIHPVETPILLEISIKLNIWDYSEQSLRIFNKICGRWLHGLEPVRLQSQAVSQRD